MEEALARLAPDVFDPAALSNFAATNTSQTAATARGRPADEAGDDDDEEEEEEDDDDEFESDNEVVEDAAQVLKDLGGYSPQCL